MSHAASPQSTNIKQLSRSPLVGAYVLFLLLIPFFPALVFPSEQGQTNARSSSEKGTLTNIACSTGTGLYAYMRGWGIESKDWPSAPEERCKQPLSACTCTICRMAAGRPRKKVTCLRVETLVLIGCIV